MGITNYVVRDFNAYCADFGVTFGYEFNPDWVIFMEAAYQISFDESLQNLAGVELSDPEIDLSGAMIQIEFVSFINGKDFCSCGETSAGSLCSRNC